MNITVANRDITALTPLAQRACRLFLETCERHGLRIFLTETYRSQARQDYLYEQGRTRPGEIVTWTRSSRHTDRRAWDIACKPPQDLYDRMVLDRAGRIALRLGLIWGGNWSPPDRPHIEMPIDWREPKMTVEEAKKIIEDTLHFDENTMNYLTYYRYADQLMIRIAEAIQ